MHYADLSLYKNNLRNALENVKNVGWLNEGQDFSEGAVESHLLYCLKQAFIGVGRFEAETVLIRGARHHCEICGAAPGVVRVGEKEKILGASEIWLPARRENSYYAAPSLIIHYIEEHKYLPPPEFIDAISGIDLGSEFSAEDAWRKSIIKI